MVNREKPRDKDHRYDELWQEIEECDPEHLNRTQFEQMAERMERYTVADPTEQQTQTILANLIPLLESLSQHASYSRHRRSMWSRFITLLLQQVPLFSWMFWVISVVVITAGALLIPIMSEQEVNPFFIVIPLVSGFGMFYALRSYRTPMGELEATFPVSPAEIMIGRLGIVLIYNIGFALLASICLIAFDITDSLFPFIISWLVPLCFCTVLTLVCMLKLGSLAGPILSIAIWGAQLIMRELLGPFYIISDMNDQYWEVSRLTGSVLTLLLLAYVFHHLLKKDKGALSDADSA